MSRSRFDEIAMPVFGRFLWLAFDWSTSALSPLGRALSCSCSECVQRRAACASDQRTGGTSLTIGKGVAGPARAETHALPDGQGVPPGNHGRGPAHARAGFTLVEMLVVLLILAALTITAVQSLSPVADQARYDATRNTLTSIEAAVRGSDDLRQPDSTPSVTGFVADVGRLPRVLSPDINGDGIISDAEIGTELRELWGVNSSLPTDFPYRIRTGPTGFGTVAIPCGWRGPYLSLGPGVTGLRDGEGTTFTYLADGASKLQTVDSPLVDSGVAADIDVSSTGRSPLVTVSGVVNITSTSGSVTPTAVTVRLLGPGPEEPDTNHLKVWNDVDNSDADNDENTNDDDLVFEFSNVPIGSRAIHVTIGTMSPVVKYIVVTRTVPQVVISVTIP